MKRINQLLLFLFMLLSISAYSNNNFKVINCENQINNTINQKLIFFVSDYGFVTNTNSGSPLQENIPEEVGTNSSLSSEFTNAVIVQEIPTNDLGKIRLEGGVSKIYYILFVILGAIIGLIVANFIEQNPTYGLIIGGIAGYFIAMFAFDTYEDDFYFTIDNATNQEVSIHLNNISDSIVLPEKSQIRLIINEGERILTLKNTINHNIIESHKVNTIKYKKDDEHLKGHYIYNIANKNSYSINFVIYKTN